MSACEPRRSPCRRRTGEAPLRAEEFGDLILADHKSSMKDVNPEAITGTLSWCKILSLNGFNLIRAKQNLHMRRKKSSVKSLEPSRRPKVVFTGNYVEFVRACDVLSWNHRTSTPHRSETNGIAEGAVRRVKKSTSAVLLQLGQDEKS